MIHHFTVKFILSAIKAPQITDKSGKLILSRRKPEPGAQQPARIPRRVTRGLLADISDCTVLCCALCCAVPRIHSPWYLGKRHWKRSQSFSPSCAKMIKKALLLLFSSSVVTSDDNVEVEFRGLSNNRIPSFLSPSMIRELGGYTSEQRHDHSHKEKHQHKHSHDHRQRQGQPREYNGGLRRDGEEKKGRDRDKDQMGHKTLKIQIGS